MIGGVGHIVAAYDIIAWMLASYRAFGLVQFVGRIVCSDNASDDSVIGRLMPIGTAIRRTLTKGHGEMRDLWEGPEGDVSRIQQVSAR